MSVRNGTARHRNGEGSALGIADGSGVVFVAKERIDDVLCAAEEIAARERAMTEAVERGTPVSRVMGGDYETMLGGRNDGESR